MLQFADRQGLRLHDVNISNIWNPAMLELAMNPVCIWRLNDRPPDRQNASISALKAVNGQLRPLSIRWQNIYHY